MASWLVDVLNVFTGNLDRPGGAMFTTPAAGGSQHPRHAASRPGRAAQPPRSRVRGLPETFGELPAVCLAEEIETPGRRPGPGAGHASPATRCCRRRTAAASTPRSPSLEFMVSVDIYVNETTRHADVILPAPSALQKPHYDVALLQLALRNVANWSRPGAAARPTASSTSGRCSPGSRSIAQGAGADADPAIVDDLVIGALVGAAVADEHGPLHGRDADESSPRSAPRTGPARIIDFMLRTGPYGDRFGTEPDGLTLDALLAAPHGIDLGPLEPRLPDGLRTPTGMIELAPAADPRRPAAAARRRSTRPDDGLRARRPARPALQQLVDAQRRGAGEGQARAARCRSTPTTPRRVGLVDGGQAKVTSAGSARVVVPVEVTDGDPPRRRQPPHGWGHDLPGVADRRSPPATPA